MIQVRNVSKSFGDVRALDGIDLNVQTGSIYGLIGTNGAGKTTVIRHLAGILKQDSGEILFDGQPVWEDPSVKSRIGLIPDELYFPAGYSMNDMAGWYQAAYPTWDEARFSEMAELFGLETGRRIRTFSKGMKKQAAFCLVMACRPDYLLLDEPIDGLDPIVRKMVWKVIVDDVAERQTTVLVSSHNLKEMEGICDSIGILSHGKTVIERDLDDLRGTMHKVQAAWRPGTRPEELPEELVVLHHESRGSVEMMIVQNDVDEIEELLGALDPVICEVLPLSLEEIFICEMGGEEHDIRELIF